VSTPSPGSATPTAPLDDEQLRGAAASVARATGSRIQPVTVLRHGEIVIVVAVRDTVPAALEERLSQAGHNRALRASPGAIALAGRARSIT
jgi:hypothetical protein